jgi:NAD(P)-dependent dehydrogenase (short-subunit alcohol dehydrogenase family)
MSHATGSEVVVITGASAGVGRATVRAFAKRGARIGLVARGKDALDRARQEVRELGGQSLVCVADVANQEEVEAAATAIEKEFGPIDIWVNNAMVSVFSPFLEMTPEEFRRVTEVTYLGYVWGTMAALKRMHPRNRGVIIQVGSALAYRGIPLQSAYCGAKHAIQGLTDSLRSELLHDRSKVRVMHGAAPGPEHASVRLGQKPVAPKGPACSAHLSAGDRRRGDPLCGNAQPSRNLRRVPDRQGDRREQNRARICG